MLEVMLLDRVDGYCHRQGAKFNGRIRIIWVQKNAEKLILVEWLINPAGANREFHNVSYKE